MCFREEGLEKRLSIHCQWVSALWHLSLSLVGVSGYNLKLQETFDSMEELKKSWVPGAWK